MGRDFAQSSREPHHAKPAAAAGARGGRRIEAAFKSLVDQAVSLLCLSATTCNGFSQLCDTGRQQDPTLVAAISPACPQALSVPRWPLLPTAVVPTCFQTFNLLTLRKPWEAGKVVLSSFYSGKHEWFPYKYCSGCQQRWDPHCIHQGSLPGKEGRSLPPSSIFTCLVLHAKCHLWQGELCPPCPTPTWTSISHIASSLIPQFSSEDEHNEALQLNLGPNACFPAILIHQHASNCYVWRGV